MKAHDKYTLPPEFRSGNNIPVERATITRERMVEILTEAVESYIETLFKIGEHLGIDYQAARTAPGKPSDVYIAAIEADRQRANEWRKLAHQFDSHRMQAIGHLKAIVDHLPVDMQSPIRNFLSSPPDRQVRDEPVGQIKIQHTGDNNGS